MITEKQAPQNENLGFLWKLLANPADGSPDDIHALEALVHNYPQSGVLQALYACIGDRKNFKRASVYFNTKSLYKLLNNPESFLKVPAERIILGADLLKHPLFADQLNSPASELISETENQHTFENTELAFTAVHDLQSIEEAITSEFENKEPELDLNAYQESIIEEDITQYRTTEDSEPVENNLEAQELLAEPITARIEVENKVVAEAESKTEEPAVDAKGAEGTVTKYDDETLPYTFLWWLNKLRKEHKQNYRPYANTEAVFHYKFKRVKKPTDDLQFQYIENIFHINAVSDLEKHTADKPEVIPPINKEHEIIERFIKEEPQIRPMQIDKIDSENKAKKSSEERESFVTETLAKIYSEQGLNDKAIAAYQKLILKFPEKTRYFADKIEQLQKKTDL